MEEWRDIEGYEGLYQVSNKGRVRNINKNPYRMMKPHHNQRGYCQVALSSGGTYILVAVHRLVAQAFIPNPNCLPQVNHKDEVKDNNSVDNLEWCNNKYNCGYGTRGKRIGEKLKGVKHSDERRMKRIGHFVSEETKTKIAEALKGKVVSEDTKAKLSKALKGKKRPKEVIDKMREKRKIPIIQYTKQLEFIAEYPSTIDAIEALGLPKSGNAAICKCLKGKIKSYKGFVWKYA